MIECPCGSSITLDACCGLYIGGNPTPTALSLMKSRYSAFVLVKGEYLKSTLSEHQKADFDSEEFEQQANGTKWMGLEIRNCVNGGLKDETGTVEFVAKYKEKGQHVVHHELAKFTREDGKWVFNDCVVNPKLEQRIIEKIGRNDPCSCGSNKKFKKCCGA